MNIYHLRYFVTLAHLEHYTKAAEVLSLTQPSLSYAMNSLEEELGVKLFEKRGRNITLTKYGKKFLIDAEDILEKLDASVNDLSRAGQGHDTIEIGFLRILGSNFVPRLMRRYIDARPDQEVHFHLNGQIPLSGDIIEGLKEKYYEIAFCSKVKEEHDVEFIPVCREELVAIAPISHPLAEKDEISLEELCEYPFIAYTERSGLHNIVQTLFMDNIGKVPEIAHITEEDQVVAGLVANGFGVAIVPHMPLLDALPLKIFPLKDIDYERNFYMCYLKNGYLAPACKDFIEFVKNLTAERPFLHSEIMRSPF